MDGVRRLVYAVGELWAKSPTWKPLELVSTKKIESDSLGFLTITFGLLSWKGNFLLFTPRVLMLGSSLHQLAICIENDVAA